MYIVVIFSNVLYHPFISYGKQRPEPTTTLALSLATLSRIFNLLTLNKPSLTREITSPNLKPFLESVLNLLCPPHPTRGTSSNNDNDPPVITDSPVLLPACLKALAQTLLVHPTTFRPFVKRTTTIVVVILSSGPYALIDQVEALAREIFVNLHLPSTPSAPLREPNNRERNNTTTSVSWEWSQNLHATILDLHLTLDIIFSPVVEDPSLARHADRTIDPHQASTSSTKCPLSESLPRDFERTLLLLRILSTFFTLPTSTAVTTPLADILLLTHRILALTPRTSHLKPAYPTSSWDALFTAIPRIHTATISLIDLLARRLGTLFIPCVLYALEQLSCVWEFAQTNSHIRIAVYTLLNTILRLCGAGIPQGHLFKLVPKIAEVAVQDILAPYISNARETAIITNTDTSASGKGKKGGRARHSTSKTTSTFADTLLSASTSAMLPTAVPTITPLLLPYQHRGETRLAVSLLKTLITTIPPQRVPSELRTKIDQLAVVMNERELMLASVLSPPGYVRASLLPFLVAGREVEPGIEMGIQGVVWPRMPVVRVRDENDVEDDAADDELEGNEEVFELENQRREFSSSVDPNSLWMSKREEWEKIPHHSTSNSASNPTATSTATSILSRNNPHVSPPSQAAPQPPVLAKNLPPVANPHVELDTLHSPRPIKRPKLTETPNPLCSSAPETPVLQSTPFPNATPEPAHPQPPSPHQPHSSSSNTLSDPQLKPIPTVKRKEDQEGQAEMGDEDDEMVIPEIDLRSDTDTDTDTEEDIDTDQEEQE